MVSIIYTISTQDIPLVVMRAEAALKVETAKVSAKWSDEEWICSTEPSPRSQGRRVRAQSGGRGVNNYCLSLSTPLDFPLVLLGSQLQLISFH